MKKIMILVFLFSCCFVVANEIKIEKITKKKEQTGRVKGNRLNVRARPGVRFEVISQFRSGDKITIAEINGDWLHVYVPENSKSWIAAKFVSHGVVMADKVKIRSGPGIAFSPYARLGRGDKVRVLEEHAKWLRIEAHTTFKAWINKKFVSIDNPIRKDKKRKENQKKLKREDKLKAEAEQKKIEERLKEIEKKSAKILSIKKEIKIMLKGRTFEGRGFVLRVAPYDSTFVDFALAKKVNGQYYPICYLKGKKEKLLKLIGKEVNLQGDIRWLKGWKKPVVTVNILTRK